jgi:hypothetical protein
MTFKMLDLKRYNRYHVFTWAPKTNKTWRSNSFIFSTVFNHTCVGFFNTFEATATTICKFSKTTHLAFSIAQEKNRNGKMNDELVGNVKIYTSPGGTTQLL